MSASACRRSHVGWMMTFADLLGLLLCFFVMLFAMRGMPAADWGTVREALDSRFETGASQTMPVQTDPAEDEAQYLETWLRARLAEQPELAGLLVERNDRGIGLRLSPSMELTQKGANTLVAIIERLDNRLMLVLPAGTVDELSAAAERARTFRAALAASGLKRPVAIILDPEFSDPELIIELGNRAPIS